MIKRKFDTAAPSAVATSAIVRMSVRTENVAAPRKLNYKMMVSAVIRSSSSSKKIKKNPQ